MKTIHVQHKEKLVTVRAMIKDTPGILMKCIQEGYLPVADTLRFVTEPGPAQGTPLQPEDSVIELMLEYYANTNPLADIRVVCGAGLQGLCHTLNALFPDGYMRLSGPMAVCGGKPQLFATIVFKPSAIAMGGMAGQA